MPPTVYHYSDIVGGKGSEQPPSYIVCDKFDVSEENGDARRAPLLEQPSLPCSGLLKPRALRSACFAETRNSKHRKMDLSLRCLRIILFWGVLIGYAPPAGSFRGAGIQSGFNDRAQSRRTIPQLSTAPPGRVSLIGVGPGVKTLITVEAAEMLERGDALVIADPEVGQEILDLVKGELRMPHLGGSCRRRALDGDAQAAREVEEWVMEGVQAGRDVIRLKVGDPFLFQNGGEEMLTYGSLGVESVACPGISSALAAPLLGGVPLTHRGVADVVTICDGEAQSVVDDPPPDSEFTSLVFLGVKRQQVDTICQSLISSGHPDKWAAAVENAGMLQQHVIIGSLSTMPQLALEHSMQKMTIVVGGCVRAIHRGSWIGALHYQGDALRQSSDHPPPSVTLIGAGPGAAQYLTVAGREALARADLVIADRLVGPGVLELVKPGAEVHVPDLKKGGKMDLVQEYQIYAWVRQGIQEGKHVVRLKVGDPFLYGRGGEEVLEYQSYGVTPRVIPGISSALSAPLLGGIPLTSQGRKGQTDRVTICTGFGEAGVPLQASSLPLYRGTGTTCVLLMAMGRLHRICAQLQDERGWPGYCGAAIVERAGTDAQATLWGTLASIAALAVEAGAGSPAVVVIGESVDLLV